MKLIIDIDDTIIEGIRQYEKISLDKLFDAVKKGIPYKNTGDLISRSALMKEVENAFSQFGLKKDFSNDTIQLYDKFTELVLFAPTVEYPFYAEAYQTGYEEVKNDVIRSIAKQYSEHNELVPSWLHIGNMKEADNGND